MRVNKIVNKPSQEAISKPTIHNVFILDSSGSMMGGKYDAALKGINLEIEALKKQTEVNYIQTIVEFSNYIENKIWMRPLLEIPNFQGRCFGGGTALYDAVGKTLDKLLTSPEKSRDDKVLVKIFTDGEENTSISYNLRSLTQKIEDAEKAGFTITFEGTSSDVNYVIKNLNIKQSNTKIHDNTAAGIERSVQARVGATMLYAKSVVRGEDVSTNFYTKSVEK